MRQMTSRMGGGMMGGGMMGGGMMGGMPGSAAAAAAAKKDVQYLTRTDFLLQFVWIPPKPGSLPKDPEELKKRLEEEDKKLADAEKAYAPDVSTAKIEETLEEESRKKSQALDSAPPEGIERTECGSSRRPAGGRRCRGDHPAGGGRTQGRRTGAEDSSPGQITTLFPEGACRPWPLKPTQWKLRRKSFAR